MVMDEMIEESEAHEVMLRKRQRSEENVKDAGNTVEGER